MSGGAGAEGRKSRRPRTAAVAYVSLAPLCPGSYAQCVCNGRTKCDDTSCGAPPFTAPTVDCYEAYCKVQGLKLGLSSTCRDLSLGWADAAAAPTAPPAAGGTGTGPDRRYGDVLRQLPPHAPPLPHSAQRRLSDVQRRLQPLPAAGPRRLSDPAGAARATSDLAPLSARAALGAGLSPLAPL
eukprot:gene9932-20838_t